MELGLKLMPIIGSNFFDTKRELGDDVVDEGNGVDLIVTLIDLEGPDAGCIINGSVLVTLDRLVVFALEYQEFNIDVRLVGFLGIGFLFIRPASPSCLYKHFQR